jgi:peroxiredoxin
MKLKVITSIILFSCTTIFAQIPKSPNDISPLLIGEKIPNSILLSINNDSLSSDKLFQEKPSVLLFYRGGWCPYCTKHLSAIGEIEPDILKLGYQIIAITNQGIKEVSKTVIDYPINYKILSDPKGQWMQNIGIAFQPNERTLAYMQQNSEEGVTETLPVPSVFIVDKQGIILFEHIDPNYSKRIESAYLLKVLEGLK